MSFSRKLGWLAKQSLGNSIASAGPAPTLHMFNSIRCMSTRLFVGGLSYSTDDANLRDTFTEFGELTEAVVLVDRITGKSRGFGFVDYTTDESASNAISNMDGKELQGRHIRVSYARERVARGFGGEPSPEA